MCVSSSLSVHAVNRVGLQFNLPLSLIVQYTVHRIGLQFNLPLSLIAQYTVHRIGLHAHLSSRTKTSLWVDISSSVCSYTMTKLCKMVQPSTNKMCVCVVCTNECLCFIQLTDDKREKYCVRWLCACCKQGLAPAVSPSVSHCSVHCTQDWAPWPHFQPQQDFYLG